MFLLFWQIFIELAKLCGDRVSRSADVDVKGPTGNTMVCIAV